MRDKENMRKRLNKVIRKIRKVYKCSYREAIKIYLEGPNNEESARGLK